MNYVTFERFTGNCPYFETDQTIEAKYKLIGDKYFSLLYTECEYQHICGINDCPVKANAPNKFKG